MPALRRTVDFFELRPFFKLWALRAFWWIDIYVELDRLYSRKGALRLIAHFPDWAQAYNFVNLFLAPLTTWVSIATARLLLEVLIGVFPAAAAPRSGPRRYPGSAWQEFVAFIDLKPFFTRWWLQVFWWLYLLDALKLAYGNIAFNMPPLNVQNPILVWSVFLAGFLSLVAYTGGLRLLIEVAAAFAPGGQDARSAAAE